MTLSREELRKVYEHFTRAYPPKYQAFFEMDEKTIDVKEDGSVHFTADEKHGGFAGSEATGNTKNFIAKKVGDVYEISEN